MNVNLPARVLSIITAILVNGCASYAPSLVRLNPSGPNVYKAVNGDLTVYVDEYRTPAKSERAFDTDLGKEGVLPLMVSVENNGKNIYEVKRADILIRGDRGLRPVSAEEAADKAGRSAVGRALGWSMIVPIISIPIAVVASAIHTSRVNDQIVRDFAAKSFADGEIMPNKERSGFVFFESTGQLPDLANLTLELKARNTMTNEAITISTPLGSGEVVRDQLGPRRFTNHPKRETAATLDKADTDISAPMIKDSNRESIRNSLVGKTVAFEQQTQRGKTITIWRYFSNDHEVKQTDSRDRHLTGKWSVTSDGRYCDNLRQSGNEVCFKNVRVGIDSLVMQGPRAEIVARLVSGNPKGL